MGRLNFKGAKARRGRVVMATVLICTLLIALTMPAAFGAELYHVEIAQAVTRMPKIVTYFQLSDIQGNTVDNFELAADDISASLDGKELEIVSLERQAASGCGTYFYYLLDVSASVPGYAFQAVKNGICNHIASKNENDRIVVITFGTSVDVVVSGNESANEAISALRAVRANQGYTHLYEAVSKVVELADAVDDSGISRPVIMLATDGIDTSTASGSQSESLSVLQSRGFPVYAFGYQGSSQSSLNALGEFSRATGGNTRIVNSNNGAGAVATFVAQCANMYRLECRAKSNIIQANTGVITLRVNHEGETYSATRQAVFYSWIKDEQAPSVTGAEITGNNTLKIVFSEDVSGANNVDSYILTNEKGQAIIIESVSYNRATSTAVLTTRETLFRGSYKLSFAGIEDISNEKNPLPGVFEFTDENAQTKGIGYFLSNYFYIPLIIIVAIAAVLVVLAARRKKAREEAEAEQQFKRRDSVSLPQIEGIPVEITVIDANKMERKVSTTIGSVYIIGRDEKTCDLAIEDKRLSRQHCALLWENELIRIQDLQSTNGTRVNGIAISKPRDISDSDVIEIANTRLRVCKR